VNLEQNGSLFIILSFLDISRPSLPCLAESGQAGVEGRSEEPTLTARPNPKKPTFHSSLISQSLQGGSRGWPAAGRPAPASVRQGVPGPARAGPGRRQDSQARPLKRRVLGSTGSGSTSRLRWHRAGQLAMPNVDVGVGGGGGSRVAVSTVGWGSCGGLGPAGFGGGGRRAAMVGRRTAKATWRGRQTAKGVGPVTVEVVESWRSGEIGILGWEIKKQVVYQCMSEKEGPDLPKQSAA
jgi:hypothetical protein